MRDALRLLALLASLAAIGCSDDASSADSDAGNTADATVLDDGAVVPPTTDAALPPPDLSAELYDPTLIAHFELDLPPESIAALAADPRTYARGTLHYGAETVPDIGVRLKGEWNFRPLDQKAAFKLKFDEFVPNQRFRGLSHMNWNNSLEDPSFIAERLVYTAFRAAGVPSPRCNSATVTVNGALYGLYVNVETEDKHLAARWFVSNDGNMYEEGGAELSPGNEGAFDLETNTTLNDRSDLTALFAAIDAASDDTLLADLDAVLDTTEFLRYSALEGVVNQWDGYAYTRFGPNNFRLYHDPGTGKFSFIPWGMDMSLKPLNGEDNMSMLDVRGMLLQRCMNGASCRAAYEQTVRDMTTLWESLAMPALAMTFHDQIQADAFADPRKEVDNGTFEATVDVVHAFVTNRPDAVRAEIP